ncbi:DUF6538 domain-containing protein [Celeribacter sp.]|uniref:DUF6538 domain-containing protein n=1 Tax=Celeribacter sp. TaxID=1890673 RepID=UPI003A91D145
MKFIPRGQKKILYMRKRVPRRFQDVEEREFVWLSLHTDSQTVAREKANMIWAECIEAWEALQDGHSEDGEKKLAGAKRLAARRGYRYMPAEKVADLPLEEIIDRVEKSRKPDGTVNRIEAQALLGGVEPPAMTLSKSLETYWELAESDTFGKTDDQIRRWKNPRKKAFRNFIGVVGDKPINEITVDDVLDFRKWLSDRMTGQNAISANSANKDIRHISSTLRRVVMMKRLNIDLPFSGMAFKEGKKNTRAPFSTQWITEKLLAPGALDGLNLEARCVLIGMINTGYRPSEATGLLPHHIRLDADIPYIDIKPEGRQLKNASSERIIPLAGVSLEAFRECAMGFPRYRFKDTLSDTVNKFLRENKLLETDKHTLYGLRHSFEDRMLAAGVDERIRRDLFGHSLGRERYGKGATLEHALGEIKKIAI